MRPILLLQLLYPERPRVHSIPDGQERAKRQKQVLPPPEGVGFADPRYVTLNLQRRQTALYGVGRSIVAVRATPWVDGCSQAWVGYFAILAA